MTVKAEFCWSVNQRSHWLNRPEQTGSVLPLLGSPLREGTAEQPLNYSTVVYSRFTVAVQTQVELIAGLCLITKNGGNE